MANVIDSLIVELGLDPSKFRKGTAEAERQTKHTQEAFKKSGEAMTRSLVDVARNVFVAFVGFESVSGLVNFLGKLNQVQASLGRMAANFGVSARALDVWDKKIELAGGTVAGAQSAINQLNQDVIALQTQGAVSPLLVFLNRLGVAITDSAGHMRDAKTVYEEMFKALGKIPRATAFQLGTAAGVSPDLLSYGLRPQAERAAIDAEAARLSRTTDASTRAADQLRERWVAIQESISAIGVTFLEKITPSIERMLPVVERFATAAADWIASFGGPASTAPAAPGLDVDKFNEAIDARNAGIEDKRKVIERIKRLFAGSLTAGAPAALGFNLANAGADQAWAAIKRFFSWSPAPYAAAFQSATTKYDLPPGLLESIADRESNFDPNAVSDKGAVGLMQLLPKFFPNAGKDPNADIEEAARYLRELYGQFGNWGSAVAAYNAGPGRITKAQAGQANVPKETVSYVTQVAADMRAMRSIPAPPAAGPVSHNEFNITVNTREPVDGRQVGIDFMAEMKKRNLVLQADTGIVP